MAYYTKYYIKEETLDKVRKFELNRRGVKKPLNYAIDCCNEWAKRYYLSKELPERKMFSVVDENGDKTLYTIIVS
jgi:hypothetical protein